MKNLVCIICAFGIILGLSACATPTTVSPQGSSAEIDKEARLQKRLVLKKYLEEDRHIKNIAFPILKDNAELCTKTNYSLGLDIWNEHSLPNQYKDTANILYGIGEVAQVQSVYKNTPAATENIMPGDKLIAVNDQEVPHGKKAIKKIQELLEKDEDANITITLTRNGQELKKDISRIQLCKYGVVYDSESMEINAYADGENIYVTRGMYRFIDNDDELALVISHELGHNAMGHSEKKETNMAVAGIGGLAIDILAATAGVNTQGAFTDAAMRAGGNVYSVAFEQEADYVGMYFMERAGYNTADAANFWRRMAAEYNDSTIKKRTTHPATAERFVAIEKTYEEIQTKKKNGIKLEPELDEGKAEKAQLNTKPKQFND